VQPRAFPRGASGFFILSQCGGDLVAQLYGLRQCMVGYWDFDAMARAHGKLCCTSAAAMTSVP
jgi:hypothetical protein